MAHLRKVRASTRNPELGTRNLHALTIHAALEVLGVERAVIYATPGPGRSRGGPRFWITNARDLDGLLQDFHGCYKRAIKRAHVDHGGTHEAAVRVNAAWARVKKLFGQRGIRLD